MLDIDELPFHPVAEIFPLMKGEEFSEFVEDIRTHGLRVPITTLDGMILDGRNRYRACRVAGVTERTESFGGTDPLEWVISSNLHRRHLNESQRAIVAAKLANLGVGRPGKTAPIGAVSQPAAARRFNVSRRSVQRASAMLGAASPAIVEAAEQGKIHVSLAIQVADMPASRQAEIAKKIQGGARATHAVLTAARTERAQQIETESAAQPLASLGRRFPVIYADPPWSFETWTPAGMGRAAEQHYPCMALEDICALPVPDIAADDAVLFMWATAAMIPEALQVVTAWGFAYKTNAIWAKDSIGLGYWLRNQHEHLIIATRGKMPPPAHARSSVFHGASGRHSEKPASVREWICDAYPHVGRIELFARDSAPGWAVWGHEAPVES